MKLWGKCHGVIIRIMPTQEGFYRGNGWLPFSCTIMMADWNNYYTVNASAVAAAGAGAILIVTGNGKSKGHSQLIQPPLVLIHKANYDILIIITQGYYRRNILWSNNILERVT